MKIQKAYSQDGPIIAKMNYQLIRDEGHRNPMNQSQLARRMKNWLHGEYEACIFKEQDKVIGYCLFRKEKEFVYIRQFYIEQTSRRNGFGRKAFDLLRKKTWEKSHLLRLDVLIENKDGIKFWKALGFMDYCLTMELKK